MDNGERFGLVINQYNDAFFVDEPDSIETTNSVNNGAWRNVVVTYDGAYVALYIDGSPDRRSPFVLDTVGQALEIGRSTVDHSWPEPFFGLIDELRIYDRVLRTDEIGCLFSEGSPR
jgi:hypothetical protein